ncbi:MAG: transposase [Planctomycetia bacterium]|nr:MAG: transposase [Planctomycetia bacterium]
MLYVGIDWADDHHDIVITDDSAKTLDQFRIDHLRWICPASFTHRKSPNIIQPRINRHRNKPGTSGELLQKGYTVYAINPKAVNRYKDRHVLSKAKSDVLDALSLGHLLRTDRHLFRPLEPFPKITDFLIGFAVTFGKRLMKNQELSTRLSPARKNFIPRRWKCFPEFTDIH